MRVITLTGDLAMHGGRKSRVWSIYFLGGVSLRLSNLVKMRRLVNVYLTGFHVDTGAIIDAITSYSSSPSRSSASVPSEPDERKNRNDDKTDEGNETIVLLQIQTIDLDAHFQELETFIAKIYLACPEVVVTIDEWCGIEYRSQKWDQVVEIDLNSSSSTSRSERRDEGKGVDGRSEITSDSNTYGGDTHGGNNSKRWGNDDRNKWGGFNVAAVGGTFDHLHAGHKILLSMTSFISSSSIVGVTGASLLKNKKFADKMQSYDLRAENVKKFMGMVSCRPVEVVKIEDVAGPTGTRDEIDVLVASKETESSRSSIDSIRLERGLRKLEYRFIELVGGEGAEKMSSTAIRARLS